MDIFDLFKKIEKQKLKTLYMGLIAANAAICGFVYLLAPVIIKIVSGEQYLLASPVLRVLTVGYFFSGTFRSLSANILAAFRRVRYGLFISIVSCVATIVFNYCFIVEYGMIGAAYATLVVDLIAAVLSFSYVVVLIRKGTINETC